MHPPLTSTISTNNHIIRLSQEHRSRLYQLVNELTDDEIRLFLMKHFQTISNSTLNNQFQHHSRTQLIQQAYILIDNNYSVDLEQSLYTLKQNRLNTNYRQEQLYRSQQQQQQNFTNGYNQQGYYFNPQAAQYNMQPNYRFQTTPQYRQIRPTQPTNQTSNNHVQQPSSYYASVAPRQQYIQPGSVSSISPPTSSSSTPHYQGQVLLPPPSVILRPTPTVNPAPLTIVHKTLPFYQPLSCVYECLQAFRFDNHRKQFYSRNEFLLSIDICNQLALSSEYDADLDTHKTNKCLILRLVRTDQPPLPNGKYDDSLPPNLTLHVNTYNVTNLPAPKPCTRQQADLLRPGREIDITPCCMFNPALKNEITMTWFCRQDNATLQQQYSNAQYALHVFLVKHLTVDDLYEQIKNKKTRFYRDDTMKLLAKAMAIDRDLGLEVSDQKLKLKCPIDQRRLRTPVRATTCQHIQCFDLTNYITINEKAAKWTCPVCNKIASYDDLQIDAYTESILNSIQNEDINEISIDSQCNWRPVTLSSTHEQQNHHQQIISNVHDIVLDDDDDDDNNNNENHHQIDEKPNLNTDSKSDIPKISSVMPCSSDIILLDDD